VWRARGRRTPGLRERRWCHVGHCDVWTPVRGRNVGPLSNATGQAARSRQRGLHRGRGADGGGAWRVTWRGTVSVAPGEWLMAALGAFAPAHGRGGAWRPSARRTLESGTDQPTDRLLTHWRRAVSQGCLPVPQNGPAFCVGERAAKVAEQACAMEEQTKRSGLWGWGRSGAAICAAHVHLRVHDVIQAFATVSPVGVHVNGSKTLPYFEGFSPVSRSVPDATYDTHGPQNNVATFWGVLLLGVARRARPHRSGTGPAGADGRAHRPPRPGATRRPGDQHAPTTQDHQTSPRRT